MLRNITHTLKKLMSQPLRGLWEKINPVVCEFQHLLCVIIKIHRQCRCLLDNPLTDGLIFQLTPFLVPLTPCRYSSKFHCSASLCRIFSSFAAAVGPVSWSVFAPAFPFTQCISCSLCSSSRWYMDNKWSREDSSHSWPSQSSLSSDESVPGQRHEIYLP